MSAWLIAGADAIQKDVESNLGQETTYKKLGLDEKLARFQHIAAERMAATLGLDFAHLRPWITDYIGLGASIYEHHHTMDVAKKATLLGLAGIELHSVDLGGASLPAALGIAQRLCAQDDRLVLIAGAEVPRGGPTGISYYREVNDALLHPDTELHTHTNLISLYALLADRMRFEYGISIEQVEGITEFYRRAALADERAASYGKTFKTGELRRYLAGCYATPMVAVATDHGVAFLVAGEKALGRLRTLPGFIEKSPLAIAAVGTNNAPKYLTQRNDFSSPGPVAARRAFARAAMVPADIDYAWIYDCFTLMLVRQAADYFGIDPYAAAETLTRGELEIGNKRIPVNSRGGILNTQAAISLSASSGLLDILNYAAEHHDAQSFLFGGNGGLDTVNSVAILTRTAPHTDGGPEVHIPDNRPVHTCASPTDGEALTLYAAVNVRFNPGTAVPFALGAFRRSDQSLLLAHIADENGNPAQDTDRFVRDAATFRLMVRDGTVTAVYLG